MSSCTSSNLDELAHVTTVEKKQQQNKNTCVKTSKPNARKVPT